MVPVNAKLLARQIRTDLYQSTRSHARLVRPPSVTGVTMTDAAAAVAAAARARCQRRQRLHTHSRSDSDTPTPWPIWKTLPVKWGQTCSICVQFMSKYVDVRIDKVLLSPLFIIRFDLDPTPFDFYSTQYDVHATPYFSVCRSSYAQFHKYLVKSD